MRILAVAVLIALAGCIQTAPAGTDHGGDGHHLGFSEGSAEGNLAFTGDEDMVFNVTAGDPNEFRFTRDTFEVSAGQRVGIRFHNDGDIEHEFSIEAADFHLHASGGASDEGAFIAPGPGEYVIGCYIPGHFEAGMKAMLVVR